MRDYRETLAGAEQRAAELRAFEASALATPGRLGGWRTPVRSLRDTQLLADAGAADEPVAAHGC